MSLSEIIQSKFKDKIKTRKVKKNAQEVAKFIIKDPSTANKQEDFMGTE